MKLEKDIIDAYHTVDMEDQPSGFITHIDKLIEDHLSFFADGGLGVFDIEVYLNNLNL